MTMPGDLVPYGQIPGSKPLRASKWELYARYRAQALSRVDAWRKCGHDVAVDKHAHNHASDLERKPAVRDRIDYLTKQAEQIIAAKRARLEEQLWSIHEADIGQYFESYDAPGRDHEGRPTTENMPRMRPKLLSDLDPEIRKNIEDLVPDGRGRLIPKLYSKIQANKELRAMNNIGKQTDVKDITQLSDAELIATLASQAKELGIDIDLNYKFAQAKPNEQKGEATGLGSEAVDIIDPPDVATRSK